MCVCACVCVRVCVCVCVCVLTVYKASFSVIKGHKKSKYFNTPYSPFKRNAMLYYSL